MHRMASMSCKPAGTRPKIGDIIDENQTVKWNRVGLSITVERDKELLFLAPCVEVSHVYHDTEDTPPEKSGSVFKSQQKGGTK